MSEDDMPEASKPTLSPALTIGIIIALVTALIGLLVSGATRLAETSVAHDGTLREMQADIRNTSDRMSDLLKLAQQTSDRLEGMRERQGELVGRVAVVEGNVSQLEKRIEQLSKGAR